MVPSFRGDVQRTFFFHSIHCRFPRHFKMPPVWGFPEICVLACPVFFAPLKLAQAPGPGNFVKESHATNTGNRGIIEKSECRNEEYLPSSFSSLYIFI